MSEPEFILKTTPPRLPRTALERERLTRIWDIVRDRTAIAVIAPPGFGKTTLLVQWRRRWLAQGDLVAWLTADRQDEPVRFNRALAHCIHAASGLSPGDSRAGHGAGDRNLDLDALTALLAEIAGMRQHLVLIIDDVERLPEATAQQSLRYLLYNAPPNLRVVMGSRQPLPVQTGELAAKGEVAVLKVDDLRLQLEESMAILHKRFGARLSMDDCVRLHEATEGWPIGLQLAVAAIEPETDTAAAIASLSGRHSGIERYFIESLFSRLSPAVAEFLTRIVILDRMSAQMCEAVTGCKQSSLYLDQLMMDAPVLIVAELQGWFRLHPLMRDFLLARFERLPAAERELLHARACAWFAEHERFPEAASHALAAGDEALAHSHALQSLWTLRTQGKFAEAQAWLDRIPPEQIAGDVELRLVAAWVSALGERNAEAFRIAVEVLEDPAVDMRTQFVAALVASSATGYSDQLGLVPGLFARWPEFPVQITEPVRALAYRNGMANLKLHAGLTGHTRAMLTVDARDVDVESTRLALTYRTMLLGLSHLWDGDAYAAEAVLRPALDEAERVAGRRSMVACLLAAVLAAALLERDQPGAAEALLANRLDVIERTGFPDTILLAYRSLAYIALSHGDERRALSVLQNLGALAERRRLPRLSLHSLVEQIRLHAVHARPDTASALLPRLDALASAFEEKEFQPFQPKYRLLASIAKAYAALAHDDAAAAGQQLEHAAALALQLNRGRDALTVKVLRAVLENARDPVRAQALLSEAVGLAEIGGNARLLADTHPVAEAIAAGKATATADSALARAPKGAPAAGRHAVLRSGPLTPKEAEVLALLSKGLSNKLIARVLEISDETVKWHLKNLFLKLSAGTRKHAVDRALLLGLVISQEYSASMYRRRRSAPLWT
ncbi:MAG: LuxR C-terminal-related transcriptional regulator, partial [Arenimonas sp.]